MPFVKQKNLGLDKSTLNSSLENSVEDFPQNNPKRSVLQVYSPVRKTHQLPVASEFMSSTPLSRLIPRKIS